MNIATLLGLVGGFGFIVWGILLGGSLMDYYDLPSVVIVVGGTIASTLVAHPLNQVISAFKTLSFAFREQKYDMNGAITTIINIANTARKEGLLFLEDMVRSLNEPFLQKGILLIIDGTDPELVKNILQTEVMQMQERHDANKAVFDSLTAYAPAFGMIGTLIGLIKMLKSLQDVSALGPAMAVALVTTFYGVILANLIFGPIGNKLQGQTDDETLYKTILIEGMLSIQAGENPRIIEEKLNSFLNAAGKAAKPAETAGE